MKTRKLGALDVSEIGFGTMSFASSNAGANRARLAAGAKALDRADPGNPQAGARRGKPRGGQHRAHPRRSRRDAIISL
jgi:hypothetical protein